MMSITVLVADDQALVRDGIVTVLSLAEGIEVIGEASDGIEAVALAEELTPDVVLMDLRMPNLGGAEATARLAQSCPGVRVLVLTTFGDDASIDSALRAGAAGFLTKDAGREEMIAAIRATAAGGTPLDARIAGRVVAGLPEAHPFRCTNGSPNSRCERPMSSGSWPKERRTQRSPSTCSSESRR